MYLSIIIPTHNESENIGALLSFLKQNADQRLLEIIVVDAQSTDQTQAIAQQMEAKTIVSTQKSRAKQMNLGAKHASGDVLYFVHADTQPPTSYLDDISEAINQKADLGRYRCAFAPTNMWLNANAFFTRYDGLMCSGGDLTLFVRQEVFWQNKGFDEQRIIMEDYAMVQKIRKNKQHRYLIIPKNARVSTRKYRTNSWFRVNIANLTVFAIYATTDDQTLMKRFYQWFLNPY